MHQMTMKQLYKVTFDRDSERAVVPVCPGKLLVCIETWRARETAHARYCNAM